MVKTTSLQVRLAPKEHDAVKARVADGTYKSVADAIRMAVRDKFMSEGATA